MNEHINITDTKFMGVYSVIGYNVLEYTNSIFVDV